MALRNFFKSVSGSLSRTPPPPPQTTWSRLRQSAAYQRIFGAGVSLSQAKPSARRLTWDQVQEAERTLKQGLAVLQSYRSDLGNLYGRVSSSRYGRLMRLDKPIGTHLLFLPAAWSISLGAESVTEFLRLSTLFYGGSLMLRGAGCTINDIWDADIDRQVERTKNRPIAAGEISVPAAFLFLGAQLGGGLYILTQLNTTSFLVATSSLLPVLFYPMAKRHFGHPQAALGLTMNWGALLGYSAATDSLGVEPLFLYGAGWFWTMVYDTIYANQDKKDDAIVGVSSTALTLGHSQKPILALFAAGKLSLLSGLGLYSGFSWPYYVGISASTAHLLRQVVMTDLSKPEQCHRAFVSNETTGALTWASVLLGRLV